MDAMSRLKSNMRTRLNELTQAKADGRKIIGYIAGSFFPEELVLAADAIPLCMNRGGDHVAVECSNAYVDRWLDTYCRAQIGYGTSGEDPYYNLVDILFNPVTDNNNRAVSDILDYHTDLAVFPFGIPHTKDQRGYHYFLHGLTRVKRKIEQITGVEITEERLKNAIRTCNRQRELLREISLMRKADPTPLRGQDFVMLNHGCLFADQAFTLDILYAFSREVKKRGTAGKSGPRILLTGSTLAMGDYKVFDLLSEVGAVVVIEQFAEGMKPYWQAVDTTGDSMEALARAYFMDSVAPAWFRPGHYRLEYLVQTAKAFNVDGVIWYQLMYRESYKLESHYFPGILKEKTGLSMLVLESDYDPAETGQIQTRIETYIDTLGR